MKKLLLALGLLIGTVFTASAQFWQVVKGHYEYQFFRVDSVFTPPHYSTVGRPAASQVQIILNTDSNKLQFADGTNWHTIADSVVGGGGGGGVIVNVGSAFRLGVIGTSNLKTANAKYAIILDSLVTNEISWGVDTTLVIPYTDTLKSNGMASKSFVLSQAFIKVSDSAAMLAPYLRKADTAAMLANYARAISVVKYTDTSVMLTPYLRKSDTTAMLAPYARNNLVVKYADTSSMLNVYLRKSDTTAMLSPYLRSNLGVKYTDTSAMLSVYLRKFDTTSMLSHYLRSSDAATTYYLQSNPASYITYSSLSAISGGYLTYNGTGGFGADTTSGKLATQSMLTGTIPALTATDVGYGDGTGHLTGTSTFTWNNSTNRLKLNNITIAYSITAVPPALVIGPAANFPGTFPTALTYFGEGGLNGSLTGAYNTGFGSRIFINTTSGHNNTQFGASDGGGVTTGSYNTGLGYGAVDGVSTSNEMIQIGANKTGNGFFFSGSRNILIGNDSATSNQVVSNAIFIGHSITNGQVRSNVANFGTNSQSISFGNGGTSTASFAGTPIAGDVYFNTDSSAYIMYNGAAWLRWGGSGSGGGNIISINALTNPAITLVTGSVGTDFNISTTAPGTINLNLPTVSGANRGLVTSTLFNTWNAKQNALTFGNLTEATSSVLTFTGNTGAIIGSGTTIQVKQGSGTQNGYISSTDWNTFNNKGNGIVTAIASGGPAIGIGGTAAVPIITFNLSSLPNSYATNGVHARNDSTIVGGGILDSTLYYHGTQQVTYDSILAITENHYGIAVNTINDGIILNNLSAATSGNPQYSPSVYFLGQIFSSGSKEIGMRFTNKPILNGAVTENRLHLESNFNGNPSYSDQGYWGDNPSGGRIHAALGDFSQINLSYQEVSATTNLGSNPAYYTVCTANTFTVTLPAVANISTSFTEDVILNAGSGTITFKGNASENITFGASTANSFTLAQGKFVKVHANAAGTAWYVVENN